MTGGKQRELRATGGFFVFLCFSLFLAWSCFFLGGRWSLKFFFGSFYFCLVFWFRCVSLTVVDLPQLLLQFVCVLFYHFG